MIYPMIPFSVTLSDT